MSSLKISRKVLTDNPTSTYEVSVQYMHGDADKYETEIVFIQDKLVALEFVEAIDEIVNGIQSKKRERAVWAKKYPHFFDDECMIDDVKYEDIYLSWPGDCTCDSMYPASLHSYQIFYFDEDGIKLEVEYIREEIKR